MNSNQEAERKSNLQMLAGVHTGQVKWFNRRRGYGFIKIIQSRDGDAESFIGKDVFVHQSHIKPQKSSYRSLEENEYVELLLSVDDKNVTQAVNVTGILGGSLLCDVVNERPGRGFQSSTEDGDFKEPRYNQRNTRTRQFRNNHHRNDREENDETPEDTRVSKRGNYFSNLPEDSH